ncbi:MAG: DUF2130 domain-containing protein [Verrucomicrobiae bacterium]|nr:DUF2130 domain-containing protein [Verrucomicrobiae bacterium]
MSDTTITCPRCGAEIPLTEAVSHSVREQLEADFNRRLAESNAALAERERKLAAEETALQQRRQAVQTEVARQLEAERQQLLSRASGEAQERLGLQLKELQERAASQAARLQQAELAELALRKERVEIEAARERMQLDLARTLDAERQKIAETVRAQAAEAERLRLADKDGIIKGLQNQIAALQQRAEQGSMQLQGETLEITLETDLRAAFRFDEIAEVKKGQRGADVAQRVRTANGFDCGQILWEAKRAKNWSADWPEKLKSDQREAGADLAVIVTTCPPEGVRGLAMHDGIWVCEPAFAVVLAIALRQGLINTAAQRVQQSNRADKAQALYDHLCGVGFRQQIEAVVEAFLALREQLDAEQRAFARQWKEREQQLQKAITHTAMLYGGIQGIAGREALPEIRTLALPAAE